MTLAELRAAALPRSFFARDARVVARALVGAALVHAVPGQPARAVRVVETEAYRGPRDRACHARAGLTRRTRTLFGPPAHAYVFLIYGMYDCFNVTCLADGAGHAVLLRGGEPLFGVEARADGPGRLARALAITRAHDGLDLTAGDVFFADARALVARGEPRRARIRVSARVGVAYAGAWADAPLRFFEEGNAHVSRPPARLVGSGEAPVRPAAPRRARAGAKASSAPPRPSGTSRGTPRRGR